MYHKNFTVSRYCLNRRQLNTVCHKRSSELDRLLNKTYEGNALGRLPQNRYDSLLQTYGQEQETLDKEIAALLAEVNNM